ncbi:hypothetical protein [Thermodesulforhabdus norvegica]|uniref:Uncharacterized protein n=1 Tax=Thermodesulforhabdus norvegica TaxID=39841 RepID=A0A1I4TBT1_9BACT|nr:hypothetical protein [Thermodesulforhabdus norvegica]SFM74162.1 hypothetical protein SAMN05660836_01333 [Thermodesulforhabdus norvegica]
MTGHVAPYNWRWQEDAEDLGLLIGRCETELPVRLWEFLKAILFAATLTRVELRGKLNLEHFVDDFALSHGISADFFQSMNWAVAPWVMVNPGVREEAAGRVCCFLVGAGNCGSLSALPSWWLRVADEQARRSVEKAVELTSGYLNCDLLIIPLLPDHESLQICGSSPGLAVCAGAICAHREIGEEGLPLLFSGGVTTSGKFSEPGFIGKKAAIAARHGFKVLVYGAGLPAQRVRIRCGVETIPVSGLEELEWVLASCVPGSREKTLNTASMMSSPELMASKIGRIELKVTKYRLFRDRYIKTVGYILESPENARLFAENLSRLCYIRSYHPDLGEYLVRPLLVVVEKASSRVDPLALWHISLCGWAYACTEGAVDEARSWRVLADQALAKIARTPQQLEFLADYHNRLFVQMRHLNFRFSEELPEGFRSVLEKLETLYNCDSFEAYPVLGRMYGTVAQNYGFLGPSYLTRLEEYVRRAQKAFGDGQIREYCEDWRREFNYMIYGYLDAGQFKEAREYLLPYLNVKTLDNLKCSLGKYELAALMRFAADTDEGMIIPVDTINRLLNNDEFSHPFQLILFNLGRILRERDRKRQAWVKSLTVALNLKGPRRLFGLLPLAALCNEELASEQEIMEGMKQIEAEVSRLKGFNVTHFEGLLGAGFSEDFNAVKGRLGKIWKERDKFFPFTYR